VSPIVENMIESRLAWLEIVWRRSIEALVRRVDRMKDSPIFRYNSFQDIMAVVWSMQPIPLGVGKNWTVIIL